MELEQTEWERVLCHTALGEAQSAEAAVKPELCSSPVEGLKMQEDHVEQFPVLCQVPAVSLWVPNPVALASQ